MPHPLLLNLFYDIGLMKGIGQKRAKAYRRINCSIIRDLIFHFPYALIDRRDSSPLYKIKPGQITTQVVSVEEHKLPTSKRLPYRVICSNETGVVSLVYFNPRHDYLQELLKVGEKVVVSGKIELHSHGPQIVHPDIVTRVEELERVKVLEPVYHTTYALSNKSLRLSIQNSIQYLPKLPEWIPQELVDEHSWDSWLNSIVKVHTPTHASEITGGNKYKERLAFDELLAQQLTLQLLRKHHQGQNKIALQFEGVLLEKLLKELPFELTADQKRTISEISEEQKSTIRMMRLILGDVGCGKTIIAICAILNAVEAGRQAALMVPTEILAKQHLARIQEFCQNLNINCHILISNIPNDIRCKTIQDIGDGTAQIIVGTHALFQEMIAFKDLGLVVIDEQHRFGVEQRMALLKKGGSPDFLMMSATPIPRTLCMLNYGDLNLSIIQEKPVSRRPINTTIISQDRIVEILERVKQAVADGNKVYWICPLVQQSEKLDLTNLERRLRTLNAVLPNVSAMIHGKMAAAERDLVMLKFLKGEIKVLVATTVIEVGVDVSDATIMIIEHAERFGLSQLHQLRGRIGRGAKASYCTLLYKGPLSQIAMERLQTIRECDDGFAIAAKDLKMRGAGDILGTKQSGMPEFKVYDFNQHHHLIQKAHALAKNIMAKDPTLESQEHKNLKLLLELYEYNLFVIQ